MKSNHTRVGQRLWTGARWALTAVIAFAGGCTSDVTRAEAHRLVSHGALLIDVRGAGEFAQGHPQEAINIPLDKIRGRLAELGDRNAPVVVYCHTGMRAAIAAKWLRQAGFTAVHNLGPINRWYVESLPQSPLAD